MKPMKNLIAVLLVMTATSVTFASSTVCNHQNDSGINSDTNPPTSKPKSSSPRGTPVRTQGGAGIAG